jgi:hypothetical protein
MRDIRGALVIAACMSIGVTFVACAVRAGLGSEAGTTGAGATSGSTSSSTSSATSSSTSGGSGGCAWAHVLGGPGSQYGRSVAVGGDGSVVVTIELDQPATIDGAPLASPPFGWFVIAKLDAAGAVAWTRVLGPAWPDGQVLPVAVDGAGNVFVGGGFFQTFSAGPGVVVTAPASAMFVAKLGADGTPAWVKSFPGTYDGFALAGLGADAEGNVVLEAGLSGATVEIGGQTLTGDLTLAKLDPNGEAVWAQAYPNVMPELRSFAVRESGELVVGASLYGTTNFGGGPLTTAGGYDIVVLELDAGGHFGWQKRFGNEGIQRTSALALDAQGGVLLAGTFNAAHRRPS